MLVKLFTTQKIEFCIFCSLNIPSPCPPFPSPSVFSLSGHCPPGNSATHLPPLFTISSYNLNSFNVNLMLELKKGGNEIGTKKDVRKLVFERDFWKLTLLLATSANNDRLGCGEGLSTLSKYGTCREFLCRHNLYQTIPTWTFFSVELSFALVAYSRVSFSKVSFKY